MRFPFILHQGQDENGQRTSQLIFQVRDKGNQTTQNSPNAQSAKEATEAHDINIKTKGTANATGGIQGQSHQTRGFATEMTLIAPHGSHDESAQQHAAIHRTRQEGALVSQITSIQNVVLKLGIAQHIIHTTHLGGIAAIGNAQCQKRQPVPQTTLCL